MILALVVSTILFGIGMINIDGVFSCVATKNPLILEGEGKTLILEGKSYYFHYHLGLLLIVISYVFSIGILLWYFQKEKRRKQERLS